VNFPIAAKRRRSEQLAQSIQHSTEILPQVGYLRAGARGEVFDAALRALAWCARLVVIGFAAGGGIPTLKTACDSRITRWRI
jgi:hypothetical protein